MSKKKHPVLSHGKSSIWKRPSSLVIYFTLYSIFGWLYEVFLEVVVYRWGFHNRGVLLGPYCPVYGFGALAFLLLVYPLIQTRPFWKRLKWIPLVFLLCMLIATGIELGTSYLLEYLTGSWPWQTYADYKIHFQARIALSPSLRFGLGGVLFLYILQPVFEKICSLLRSDTRRKTALALICLFTADLIYTFFIK